MQGLGVVSNVRSGFVGGCFVPPAGAASDGHRSSLPRSRLAGPTDSLGEGQRKDSRREVSGHSSLLSSK